MMIYRQLGKRRSVRGAMSFACAPLFAFLVGAPSELVSAGEFDRSTLPAAAADPAQCDSQGEGLGGLKTRAIASASAAISRRARGWGPMGKSAATPPRSVRSTRRNSSAAVRAARASAHRSVPAGQDRFSPPGSGDEAR